MWGDSLALKLPSNTKDDHRLETSTLRVPGQRGSNSLADHRAGGIRKMAGHRGVRRQLQEDSGRTRRAQRDGIRSGAGHAVRPHIDRGDDQGLSRRYRIVCGNACIRRDSIACNTRS